MDDAQANMEPAAVDTALRLVVDELLRDRRRAVRLGSVLPVRSRVDGDRGMLAVRFESENGDSYISFWGVDLGPDGCQLSGGSYSSRLGEGQATSRSWSRSGGWSADHDWFFGGVVADSAVHRVRVETRGGSTVEDIADDGVVLVIARDGHLSHATVEMFDAGGRLVSSGQLVEPRR